MAWLDKSRGRYFVYKPTHPRARKNGGVKRAIIVMEEHLNRFLDGQKEVIHHINGDPTDDNIRNLRLMSPEEHISHHHAGSKYKRRY